MQCPDNLDATQKHCWQEDSKFLLQLLDNSQVIGSPVNDHVQLLDRQVSCLIYAVAWLKVLLQMAHSPS